jgi:protein ImuB
MSAPRLTVVHCTDWPVVAAGARQDEPAAVLHANRVVARTAAAASEGVRVGHRRREAQRACPELRLIDHDPARDGREFETAVRAVAAIVPMLEVTEPGELTFLTRGPARYFGGEEAMTQRVAALVTGALAHARVGIGTAEGRFAAGVAARRALRRAGVTGAGLHAVAAGTAATRAFLDPHPVAVLRDAGGCSAELIELFERLGVRTLGALAALPAADVLARFGAEGAFAHRLARGADERSPGTAPPPADLVVERRFDDPVMLLDPLAFVGKQLAQELHERLAADGKVCTRVAVLAETDHGERSEHLWYRPGGMAAAAIAERIRWQLEGWIHQPGGLSAGVVLLRLVPDEVRADDGSQLGFWGGRTQADEWAVRAVARVAALVGEQNVLVPAAVGGRLPEDTYRWVPIDRVDVADPSERLRVPDVPWPGQLPAPSPVTVHAEPVPAEVTDATGELVRVSGRSALSAAPAAIAIGGRAPLRITGWAGPWPLDECWWDERRHRRLVRFQLTTERGEALLVVVRDGRWWITATY